MTPPQDDQHALTAPELAELQAQPVEAKRAERRGLLSQRPQGLEPGAEAGSKAMPSLVTAWKILRKWGWR